MCHNVNVMTKRSLLDLRRDESSYPFAGFSEDGSIITGHVVTDPHSFIPRVYLHWTKYYPTREVFIRQGPNELMTFLDSINPMEIKEGEVSGVKQVLETFIFLEYSWMTRPLSTTLVSKVSSTIWRRNIINLTKELLPSTYARSRHAMTCIKRGCKITQIHCCRSKVFIWKIMIINSYLRTHKSFQRTSTWSIFIATKTITNKETSRVKENGRGDREWRKII